MKVKYNKPKLTMSDSGWYVSIYYNGKLKSYKAGLNRISDLKQRKKEAKVFMKFMAEELRKGWNPESINVHDWSNEIYELV